MATKGAMTNRDHQIERERETERERERERERLNSTCDLHS